MAGGDAGKKGAAGAGAGVTHGEEARLGATGPTNLTGEALRRRFAAASLSTSTSRARVAPGTADEGGGGQLAKKGGLLARAWASSHVLLAGDPDFCVQGVCRGAV